MNARRLPEPWGTRLRRNRPLAFRFEGRSYEGFEGDTLASALLTNGVDVLSRSFKYHRPRGPLTMRGLDAWSEIAKPGSGALPAFCQSASTTRRSIVRRGDGAIGSATSGPRRGWVVYPAARRMGTLTRITGSATWP